MKGLIFTYALTYLGAPAALINPYIGFLVYICFAIIKPEALWFWSVPQGNFSRIIAIFMLVGWAIHGFGDWRLGKSTAITGFLVIFLIWNVFGAMNSIDEDKSWTRVADLAKIVMPFIVGITLIDSVAKLKQLLWVVVLSEGYLAFEFNLSYFQGYNRLKEMGFANMEEGSVAVGLVTAAGLAFPLGFHATRWWAKAAAWLGALLMLHAVFFSFSRGGMLGLISVAGVTFVMIRKRPVHYLVFACFLLLSLRLAGTEVQERFFTSFSSGESRDASAQSRFVLWENCTTVMLRYPFSGIGPACFPLVAGEFGWEKGKEGHTNWLQAGAETGIIGFISLILFFGFIIIRLWRPARDPSGAADPWLHYVPQMVIPSLVGFSVAAQFINLVTLEIPYYVALIGAGVLKLNAICAHDWSPSWQDRLFGQDPEALARVA